jgi:FkbM family methyltransferase
MIRRLDAHEDQAGAWDVLRTARGKVAFDIGANIGQSTRVLAENFDLVVALEPCQESFTILRSETPDNVLCVPLACTSKRGPVTLYETNQIETGQLTSGPYLDMGPVHGERTVLGVTLDGLAFAYGPPDFVKIDTEGHEVEVLKGAPGLRCPVLVEVHRAVNEFLVREHLPSHLLTKLTHDPDSVRPEIRANHFWLTGAPA